MKKKTIIGGAFFASIAIVALWFVVIEPVMKPVLMVDDVTVSEEVKNIKFDANK